MPMELRKRKAPAAPVPPPAPKRKAAAPKKEKKTADAAPKAEAKTTKKAALPKGAKVDKAEVTTEPPAAAAPAAEPEAPAPKAKAAKETKAAKPAEAAKKEEKAAPAVKEKKEKEKAAPVVKEKKETEKKETEKKEKKAASKSATATPAPSAAVELKSGDAIPTGLPEISNQAGEKVTITGLLDASKTGIVVFAYPAASTPGCIKQVNFFNGSKEAFETEGYSIFGLSGDKPEKNLKFKEKEKLSYPLLSDTTYELHQKFGIAKPGGKGTLRSVIVISKDGKIVTVKKAGPEETLKAARSACSLPAPDDAKLKASAEKIEAEEAPDAAT